MITSVEQNQHFFAEATLFGAKTYLLDRFSPDVERIILPAFSTPAVKIGFELKLNSVMPIYPELGRWQRLRARLLYARSGASILNTNVIYIDLRKYSPENWAHCLDFYLPLLFFIRNTIKLDREFCCLLPGSTPGYIQKLFELFEFSATFSDNSCRGDFLHVDMAHLSSVQPFALKWVETYVQPSRAFQALMNSPYTLGDKIFLSRRDTRKLSNEDVISNFLQQRGFTTLYAEDLSATEQISLFVHAKEIVAIHGAAIAPILYRPRSAPPLKFIEIFNPGHMTRFYRALAQQVGITWVGVRGQISAAMTTDAYRFDQPFLKHSLSEFTVDIESLLEAFNYLEQNTYPSSTNCE